MYDKQQEPWLIRRDLDFLNHGSFGATPRCVIENQRHWQNRLEEDPIEFLAPERSLLPKLDFVRQTVAREINASPRDIAFVRNATEGVNAVVRSLPLRAGDEILSPIMATTRASTRLPKPRILRVQRS
ncbi:aminotransferase class V-fold PLP-dependent enzyme [Rhodopirellula europaea]|uniref:Isopenicillin N epimerase n=1 Tax=Rhodopirellula europaea 6C TaxID=1263867 RepID=M2AVZ7_9BACT|nr:aminotransferase class V-fold PLP-dependent enzyme [Rhodopirellula europaea]EMB16877.1 isopenicillin N epimerase [Rhodopirellula europaea 6C]